MANINSYADLTLKGGLTFGKESNEFPLNARIGQTCFRQGILFIYANLNGFQTWYPLNRPQSSYVHSQGVEALQWTVNHGLNTTDIIVSVYDESGHTMYADVQTVFKAENPEGQRYQAILTFTEAVTGTAVVFGKENIHAPVVSAQRIDAETITVNSKPVAIEADITAALDGMAEEFGQFV